MDRNEFNAPVITDYRGLPAGTFPMPSAENPESSVGLGGGEKKKRSIWQFEVTKKRVPRADLMNFSRQLAAFIRAGIPILEAIDTFAQEAGNRTFKEALVDIGASLRQGETFSAAVAAHGKTFPSFYVDMLRAAELTGRLDSVLDQLSRYIERDLEARRKIRSAMTYPALIGVMSLGTVGILSVFVLPRFKTFFASFHAKLPLATRMVLAAGNFVGTWWWAILIGVVTAVVAIVVALRTTAGRVALDKALLKLPVVSDVVRFAIVERTCRILASMVKAGVPLPDAMVVVAESAGNKVYERALGKVRAAMLEGEGIATPITRTNLFPAAVTQMVRVGENTGTLDIQLETAAAFYEQELDYKIKKLTTLFEPAMIIFMGLVVGFVAIALVSAMYGIFRQVNLQ
ncbi:MAG: type pilus assembly protein PilC [Actinomycetota bacterium]|jgi:type IV pilus assembly protein PilC|nr:type pilus assembly protein PilC [Actinomycetota bacterium]